MSRATLSRLWRYVFVAAPQARAEVLAANAYSHTLCGRRYEDERGRLGIIYHDESSKTVKVSMDDGSFWTADKLPELVAGVKRAYSLIDSDDELSSSDEDSEDDDLTCSASIY